MSLFNPMTWDLDVFLLRKGNDTETKRKRQERFVLAGIYLSVFGLSRFWLSQVTRYVPEPYLDEIFHIPQAQAYCRGELSVWDPKLTTPPGLYLISALIIKFLRGGTCTVLELRTIDGLALMLLLFAAQGSRWLIRVPPGTSHKLSGIDWDAVHTAVNICLFPPIFFFSGLYYTDVLSTAIVIGSYHRFLNRSSHAPGSASSAIGLFLLGVLALSMRQTNIFWVAIFLGGLETVRLFEEGGPVDGASKGKNAWESVKNYALEGRIGSLHNPKLANSDAMDFLWCALSIARAVPFNLGRLILRLWPYVGLLVSFAGFVLWNGGVVLGDKSNHVATLHLSQMLYLWPFIAFFSLPLLYPNVLELFLFPLLTIEWPVNVPKPRRQIQASAIAWSILAVIVAIAIVHFNTIIHPFTLADNRHYVFYIFRYTIRRHPLFKYALAPIYVICGWLAIRCLGGHFFVPPKSDTIAMKNRKDGKKSDNATKVTQSYTTPGPTVSFTIIWFIATSLSLITAPLVEPRYFIIPWVIWRLQVPNFPTNFPIEEPKSQNQQAVKLANNVSASHWAGRLKDWAYRGHDHRLWLETIWFLLISVATGCIFLFMGFEWPQEPGKVQRFMW